MQIHSLLCFGTRAGEGNPALVVEHDRLDAPARQAFAAQRQQPACAFLAPHADADGAVGIDFYYPHTRSPLCLHATLAAARVLSERLPPGAPLRLRTRMHGQLLTIRQQGAALYVRLAPQPCPAPAVDAALAARLLDAPGLVLTAPPAVASVGSPKLLLQVADRATLHALRPRLDLIVDWGRQHGVNGCYVVCQTGADEFEGRNFNHLDPALEDSATGVAAGALTALRQRGLTLFQGAPLGTPCVIRTRIDEDAILVGGAAERVA